MINVLGTLAAESVGGKSIRRSSNLIHPQLTQVQGSPGLPPDRVSGSSRHAWSETLFCGRKEIQEICIYKGIFKHTHTCVWLYVYGQSPFACTHWQGHNLLLRLIFDRPREWDNSAYAWCDQTFCIPSLSNCCLLPPISLSLSFLAFSFRGRCPHKLPLPF